MFLIQFLILLLQYQNHYQLGKTTHINGKEIQFVNLTPIDSDSDIVKVELGIELKS